MRGREDNSKGQLIIHGYLLGFQPPPAELRAWEKVTDEDPCNFVLNACTSHLSETQNLCNNNQINLETSFANLTQTLSVDSSKLI